MAFQKLFQKSESIGKKMSTEKKKKVKIWKLMTCIFLLQQQEVDNSKSKPKTTK